MNPITVTGMVLRCEPIGEYDRRLVLLTKERGKISAFARSARKPNSALVGVTSPFTFGQFTLYEGRTSYTLTSASVSNYFEELRTDVDGAYYGFYFLDFAGYYAREGNDETQLLKLLYQSLRALSNSHIPNPLIRSVYELKIVTINGEGPQMSRCVACGDEQRDMAFSVRRGGLVCAQCGRKVPDGRKLLPSTLYAMRYIVLSPVEKLYNFVVKEEVQEELAEVVGLYLEEYVGTRFRSLEILEAVGDWKEKDTASRTF